MAQQNHELTRLEEEVEKARDLHLKLSRLLTTQGVKAIQQNNARIFKANQALDFIKTGIELERKILGMEKETPAVVNIIGAQQAIIDQYVTEEEEEEDGKENNN